MQKAFGKITERCGETLTEALVAILIIAVISGAFAALIGASGRMNQKAKDQKKELYEQISKVEMRIGGEEGTIEFSAGSEVCPVAVIYYPSDDGAFYQYEEQ